MGDFDDRIARYQEMRAYIAAQLESLQHGERRSLGMVDKTEKMKEKLQKVLLDLDAAIAAYEDLDAPPS